MKRYAVVSCRSIGTEVRASKVVAWGALKRKFQKHGKVPSEASCRASIVIADTRNKTPYFLG
jgi:hypothetical protein